MGWMMPIPKPVAISIPIFSVPILYLFFSNFLYSYLLLTERIQGDFFGVGYNSHPYWCPSCERWPPYPPLLSILAVPLCLSSSFVLSQQLFFIVPMSHRLHFPNEFPQSSFLPSLCASDQIGELWRTFKVLGGHGENSNVVGSKRLLMSAGSRKSSSQDFNFLIFWLFSDSFYGVS